MALLATWSLRGNVFQNVGQDSSPAAGVHAGLKLARSLIAQMPDVDVRR
jgi:hypothetical protein